MFYYTDPYDFLCSSLNGYSVQSIKKAATSKNYKVTHFYMQQLIKIVTEKGTIENIKEEILDVLSTDSASFLIELTQFPVESLLGLALLFSMRLRGNHFEVGKVLKKALNKKNLLVHREKIQQYQHFFYLSICYNNRKEYREVIDDPSFQSFQCCEAVEPNDFSDDATKVRILWLGGIYYEIKNYICRTKSIEQELIDVLQFSIPHFKPQFINIFVDSLLDEINSITIKGDDIEYFCLPLYRTIILFNNSNHIVDAYYATIIKTLESSFFDKGIYEINYILKTQSLSDYEMNKIYELFETLITNYRDEYSTIIESLITFLNSKQMLTFSQEFYERIKRNIQLNLKLFKYVEPFFPQSIIDDTYNLGTFNSDMADFLIQVLKNSHYESAKLDSIFLDFFKFGKLKYLKFIKDFSNQEKYKIPIFNALKKYILENDIPSNEINEICSLLNNFHSEQDSHQIIEKISLKIQNTLDSIEILPLYRDYKFLVINDLQSFVDFSPHNSLFYSILIEKDLSNFDDVVDDIIAFDDNDDENCYDSDCKAYHDFLIKAYLKTNEKKFLFKLLEITEINSQTDDLTSNEIIQVLTIFTQYLQNTENKQEIVKTIINILQNDEQNFNLKNFLINIPQLKELINFTNPEEINSLVSSLTLNDDSLAFIASIGGSLTEEQLDSLFNLSDNFYPKYIVASLFPSELEKFTAEQKLNCYLFGCIIRHYKLCKSLINSVSSLLNQENGSFEVCIFDTCSKIAELTINALPDLEIFNNQEQIQEFLVNLYSSQEQDNFDIVFSAYLNKLKKNDHEIYKVLWNQYFDSKFPPFYRNDKNNHELFKFMSTSTSAFNELISNVSLQDYSLYRPAIGSSIYQIFSNLPSLIPKIGNKSYILVFFKLLFSYTKTISYHFDKPVNDFVKTMRISENVLQSISYSFSKKGQFFSDTFQSIEPKVSVLKSLIQNRSSFVFIKSPDILIAQIEGKVSPNFVIDEELDLSPYSLNTSYYVLRSASCEGNLAYLKIGKNKYYKCTPQIVTCTNKIDSNSINLLIYEKVNTTKSDSQGKYISQFWYSEYSKILTNDINNQAILRSLLSESIDWSLFEKNEEFFNTAVSLIKLGVKNVFTTLSSSPEFSEIFLGGVELGDLIEDKEFVNEYKDEIIKLAKIYPGTPQCIFWNISDHLNLNNIELYFELLYSFNIMIEYFTNRLEIINNMKDELINTPQFEKFFSETIKMPDFDIELINKEIQSHRALIPLMLKYTKQDYFNLYSHLIDKNQFASIVDNFEPKFVIYALENCGEKASEFLPIAMKKLNGTSEWTEYIKQLSQNDISINKIKSIYLAGETELASKLLESKYPPKTTFKQDEIKEMLIELLSKSINDKNRYLSICKLVDLYNHVFENDPQITEIMAEFVFKKKQEIDNNVSELTKLITKLPPIKWSKVVDLFNNLFPIKTTSHKYIFTPLYREKVSLFLLNLASKSIRSHKGYIYETFNNNDHVTEMLRTALENIKNKEEFTNITISTFKHVVQDKRSFIMYIKDLLYFPYIYLKMLELSADCDYWGSEYGLTFTKLTISLIKTIYSGDIEASYFYYLNIDGSSEKSPKDQVSIALMNFISKQLQRTFLDPNADIKIEDNRIIPLLLSDLNDIKIEKLNDNIKSSFFKLLETIAYIYPLYNDQIVNYIINVKSKLNMYKRINNQEVKNAYSKFILNLFREIVGDREFVQSTNDGRFKNAIILLKSQFMRLLLTKDFTFEQVNPYIMIFMYFFKLKNAEIVKAFSNYLKPFPFVLYLLYTKDIRKEKVNNSTKINLFLVNFFRNVGLTDPYPEIVISFIKSLNANDPQLKERIDLLNCVLQNAFKPHIKDIAEHCFNELEKVALERMNEIPKLKDIFESFIIKLGLDY